MNIKVKKLVPYAILPSRAHKTDAGLDVYASEMIIIGAGERAEVSTGIAIEIPEGYAGLVWDKSGLAIRSGLKMLGGVIDAGYRGELKIGIVNLGNKEYVFEIGHKVAQLLIQKAEQIEIVETDNLSETERGHGGFGSTGK